jgi:protein tyrosine/serine phosphatase
VASISSNAIPVPPAAPGRRIWWGFGVLILLAIAAPIVWHNGLKNQFFPKNFGIVEPGKIYRSGQISWRLIEPTLKENNIRTIVVLSATGAKPEDVAGEVRAAADLGIDRQIFPLSGDGTGNLDTYAAAVAAIDRSVKENKPVLVHCVAGAQRTGGVIAVYRLLVQHESPAAALAEMRNFGHDPTSNPHLLEYLNDHMSELAQKLVDLGVIDQKPNPIPTLPAN